MMPQSSQNLYFHLGMNADDDGFCEHFAIMRMTDSKPDDLKVLQAKSFVTVFDDKVLVITQWKENNYIQRDRYTPSKYLAIYKKELKLLAETEPLYTTCIQDVNKMDTQVRLGEVRVGEGRLGEGRVDILCDKKKQTNPETIKNWEIFWSEYPVKKAKPVAEAKWFRIDPSLHQKIINDVKTRKASDRQWIDGFIPHPSTYLNQKRWEDEITPVRNKKPVLDESIPYAKGKYINQTDVEID